MTEATTADAESAEIRRKAEQDLAGVEQRDWIRATQTKVTSVINRLSTVAGWHRRLSDDLLTAPNGMRADFGYAGGEFYVRLYRLPDRVEEPRGLPESLTFRVTQSMSGRHPDWDTELLMVLEHLVARGGDYWVHFDPSGIVPIGLETLGQEPVVFGDRSDDPARRGVLVPGESVDLEQADVRYPIDEDDAPPDMSGSPGHDDR